MTVIECALCATVQPFAAECVACGTSFGRYTCLCVPWAVLPCRPGPENPNLALACPRPSRSECRFFDDDVRKLQFHCDKCGICRVGGRDNFFHVRYSAPPPLLACCARSRAQRSSVADTRHAAHSHAVRYMRLLL